MRDILPVCWLLLNGWHQFVSIVHLAASKSVHVQCISLWEPLVHLLRHAGISASQNRCGRPRCKCPHFKMINGSCLSLCAKCCSQSGPHCSQSQSGPHCCSQSGPHCSHSGPHPIIGIDYVNQVDSTVQLRAMLMCYINKIRLHCMYAEDRMFISSACYAR
jgi:hypothetical protein